jgi:hypothetical protein
MKTRSDGILCGEIPIETDPAIHHDEPIKLHATFETRPGQVPQLTNNEHRSKHVIERIMYYTLLRNN